MTVSYIATSKLPTQWAEFLMHGFADESGKEHVVLTLGDVSTDEPVLARVHSECLTGDALFSMRCDCGQQLQEAMKRIAETGRGLILYLRQEGRGIGLMNKIRAYELQDEGADTVEANEALGFGADMRDYSMCVPMLEHLDVRKIRLMTNNPVKVESLKKYGIDVVGREPIRIDANPHNEKYLNTKMGKMGHLFEPHHVAHSGSSHSGSNKDD